MFAVYKSEIIWLCILKIILAFWFENVGSENLATYGPSKCLFITFPKKHRPFAKEDENAVFKVKDKKRNDCSSIKTKDPINFFCVDDSLNFYGTISLVGKIIFYNNEY